MRQNQFSEQELQQMKDMFHAGSTAAEIGRALGRNLNSVRRRIVPLRYKPAPKDGLTPPRTIVNASVRGTLTGGDWQPARIGAMDYAAIKSRGF